MNVSFVVRMEVADDLNAHELKQEIREICKDIEMCMGADGYPVRQVNVTPVAETRDLRRAQHHYLYL